MSDTRAGGAAELEARLAALDDENRDNPSRTAAYLELYSWTRRHPPELPWLLMAHLVSRNAGYLMSDLALAIGRQDGVFSRAALEELFLFLERANFLIFWDAFHHVIHHLLGRTRELGDRTPPFVRGAWLRYEAASAEGVDAALERSLVLDLVRNEQELIEAHVLRSPSYARARAIVAFVEASGNERPIALPLTAARIAVGNFLSLDRRIETGRRIFDEVLADRALRDSIFEWALARPHTGSREVAGGRPTPRVVEAWPSARVKNLSNEIHRPPNT